MTGGERAEDEVKRHQPNWETSLGTLGEMFAEATACTPVPPHARREVCSEIPAGPHPLRDSGERTCELVEKLTDFVTIDADGGRFEWPPLPCLQPALGYARVSVARSSKPVERWTVLQVEAVR